MNKITDLPPAPGLGAFCIGVALGDDDRVHLSLMRREPAGGTTVLLADSFAVGELRRHDLLLLGAGLREVPTRRVSTSGWIRVIPEAAPTTLQWDDEPPASESVDVVGAIAQEDPMLPYYRDWYRLQTMKGDPSRRPDLVRDAYLSGAAQGALLARTTSVTIRAQQVDESAKLHGQSVDKSAQTHERPSAAVTLSNDELDALDTFALGHLAPRQRDSVRSYGRAVIAAIVARQAGQRTLPARPRMVLELSDEQPVVSVAECIAFLDLWNNRLEQAIDREAQEKLGQHANDGPAAGARDPMEQYP